MSCDLEFHKRQSAYDCDEGNQEIVQNDIDVIKPNINVSTLGKHFGAIYQNSFKSLCDIRWTH